MEKDNRELSEKIQNIKESIGLGNEKLIAKFECKNQKLSKELPDCIADIKQVKDNADKEFSGVRDGFDSLVSQFNEQIVQVTGNTKEIAKEHVHEVDQKLSKVTCDVVINKERSDERVAKLEANIKAV
ncbi:hypothetical protein L798_08948 [Zootermopsis nevadensis]|uniref:Uncharacterized protein n=1 Tax=Zootermopsis nevadensis TaxID=136037 RepID=A0A067QEJ2_ZOONE|nr:hypothetical protein L798_08948 [Zootermopsis nevadensis]